MSRTRFPIAGSMRTAVGRSGKGEPSRSRSREARAGSLLARTVHVLALLTLVLVAGVIVAGTAGSNLATSDPERALLFAPWEPTALGEMAQRQLTDSNRELGSVEDLARRALLFDPLDSRALSSLGLVAERKGDLDRAEALMSLAAARSRRNPTAHFWLFAQAIRRAKFEDALTHLDGLLRVYPRYSEAIFPMLTVVGTFPDGLAALEEALVANPPWRVPFLSHVVNGSTDRLMVQLYQSLIRSIQPPSANEMKPYLNRLIRTERFEEAYQDWRAVRAPAEALVRYPYNGNFEAPIDGMPFNWVFEVISGAEIQVIQVPDRGNSHAMRVQFSGARARLGDVGQLIMLTPGRYDLELTVKSSGLRTERGLVWQISCAGSRSILAETSQIMTETTSWTDLKVKFSVPSSDCRAQWLKMIIPARTAAETEIEGEIWFQGFQISAAPVN